MKISRIPTAAFVVALAIGPGLAAEPYDILLIVADDIGVEQLQAYGVGDPVGSDCNIGCAPQPCSAECNAFPDTPTLDYLMENGVRFTNAWAYPVCSPTRAALQTGRYGFRTGIGQATDFTNGDTCGVKADEVFLPELLDLLVDAGVLGAAYETAAFGKWHLSVPSELFSGNGAAADAAGYDHYRLTPANLVGPCPGLTCPDPLRCQSYARYCYLSWQEGKAGVTMEVADVSVDPDDYATRRTALWAREWIGERDGSRPWFAYLPFHAPHRPFHDPETPFEFLDPTELPDSLEPLAQDYLRAMIERLDAELGELLFESDGVTPDPEVLGNTVVIFVGDNGTDGDAVREPVDKERAKHTVWEGGVRVPLLVLGPPGAFLGGREIATPVHVVDLFPTIAEMAGYSGSDLGGLVGRTLDGRGLRGCLEQPSCTREPIYSETFSPNHPSPEPPLQFDFYDQAVRGDRYKLMYEKNPGAPIVERFIDLAPVPPADPWAQVDLCADGSLTPAEQDAYCSLRAEIETLVGGFDPDLVPPPASCAVLASCP